MGYLQNFFAFAGCISVLMLAPQLASAAPLQLGSTYGLVRTAFDQSETRIGAGGRRSLEVRAPRFAGVAWRTAEFTFDRTDHLASVTLSAEGQSFDQIEQLIAVELAEADAAPPGQEGLAQDPEGDVQIRICETGAGVTVTFERTAV